MVKDIPHDIKELTEAEARQWLGFSKPWTIEEATLIFAGHSPSNRYFFKEEGASGHWNSFNFWHRFKMLKGESLPKSQGQWIEFAIREKWEIPSLLSKLILEKKYSPEESTEQRQARLHQKCLDRGLVLPTNDYDHLPRGIGKLAKEENISRQYFAADVKAHINRLYPKK